MRGHKKKTDVLFVYVLPESFSLLIPHLGNSSLQYGPDAKLGTWRCQRVKTAYW
jgi:hypothetical protein